MSAIYLVLVLALWMGLSWALWKGWRRWRAVEGGNSRMRNAAGIGFGVLWLGVSFWYAGGQKIYYDLQVERLCAIDGGIKVYETVKLPAERFDRLAHSRWDLPDKAHAKPADAYYYESETVYLRRGDPTLIRMRTKIFRLGDGKLLGEKIYYGRGGGDLPGPWHPSSFTCPSPTEKPYLAPSIFQRGEF